MIVTVCAPTEMCAWPQPNEGLCRQSFCRHIVIVIWESTKHENDNKSSWLKSKTINRESLRRPPRWRPTFVHSIIPSTRLGVIWLRSFSLKTNIQLMSIVEGIKLNFINFPAFQFQMKTKWKDSVSAEHNNATLCCYCWVSKQNISGDKSFGSKRYPTEGIH